MHVLFYIYIYYYFVCSIIFSLLTHFSNYKNMLLNICNIYLSIMYVCV